MRRKARKAVDEMYGQMAQQLVGANLDPKTIRRNLLERALAYYADFGTDHTADAESMFEAAAHCVAWVRSAARLDTPTPLWWDTKRRSISWKN